MSVKKILILRTGGLGDTLLLWPAIAAVRQRFPEAQIDLMGHVQRCAALKVLGGVDQALEVEGSGLHLLFEISPALPSEVVAQFGVYDTVVAFAAPGDYALAENFSTCGVREVHAFLPFPAPEQPIHVADYAKSLLVGVELAEPGEDALLPVTEVERSEGRERIRSLQLDNRPLVLVAPGSGNQKKNWKAKGFAQLLNTLHDEGFEPVLLEGPADAQAVADVQKQVRGWNPKILSHDPPSRLKGIMAGAKLFVGNDSGLAHLAALVGIPTVAIFGPTDPVRWAPRGPHCKVLRNSVPCSPCSSDVFGECQQCICLDRIECTELMDACRSLL
jgi:heptosyltransferase III